MLIDNFRKKKTPTNRQRYLQYDDVFMTPKNKTKQKNAQSSWEVNGSEADWSNVRTEQRLSEYDESNEQEYESRSYSVRDEYEEDRYRDFARHRESDEPQYFSGKAAPGRSGLINERMIRYQKRHLPPLQRYAPSTHRDVYSEFNESYWDDERNQSESQKFFAVGSLGAMWQKFILTFAAILSLVCISWIAYNWKTDKPQLNQYMQNGIPVIEPSQSTFKVLPESPGGAEIAYRDKAVYGRVDNGMSARRVEEKLLPPEEETFQIPESQQGYRRGRDEVEEYSIITDKIYYIKLSAGKDRQILMNEAKLVRKRHARLFEGKEITIKKVSNSQGEVQRAILVGPYSTQQEAIHVAHEVGERCSVISVRE